MAEPNSNTNQETARSVEAAIRSQMTGVEPPAPEVLGRTLAESGLTVGEFAGICQRVFAGATASRIEEATKRWQGIQSGAIPDNGAETGKTQIVYRPYSVANGRPHPTATAGHEPIVPVVESLSKEDSAIFEFLGRYAENPRDAKFAVQTRNHPRPRSNAATITGANPALAGLTIPDDLAISIADVALAEMPWTQEANVFRSGTSEGIVGYTTKVDLDPSTEAETIDGISFGIVGENGEAPDFGKPELVAIRGTARTIAGKIAITRRMRKANPGIANWFIGKLGNAFAAVLTRKSIRGSSPWPVGFLNQSLVDFKPTLVDRETANTVTLKDLRQMRNVFPDPFYNSGFFVMRPKTQDALLDDVDDQNRPKFGIGWRDLVGPLGRESGVLGFPVQHSRHMPLLGATGDVCLVNPGSLWTLLSDNSLEIASSDQPLFTSGGTMIVAFADAGWGVMPGGHNKGIVALKTK